MVRSSIMSFQKEHSEGWWKNEILAERLIAEPLKGCAPCFWSVMPAYCLSSIGSTRMVRFAFGFILSLEAIVLHQLHCVNDSLPFIPVAQKYVSEVWLGSHWRKTQFLSFAWHFSGMQRGRLKPPDKVVFQSKTAASVSCHWCQMTLARELSGFDGVLVYASRFSKSPTYEGPSLKKSLIFWPRWDFLY